MYFFPLYSWTSQNSWILILRSSLFPLLPLYFDFCNLYWGEENGNPLQYCCPGNPIDRETWWATIHGVAKSRTRQHSTATFIEIVCELTLAHQVTFIALNPVAISPAYFISQWHLVLLTSSSSTLTGICDSTHGFTTTSGHKFLASFVGLPASTH